MLIIVEGVDGAGKTTLVNRLAAAIPFQDPDIFHTLNPPPGRHPILHYTHALDTYRPGSGAHRILDRFHWSEAVYSPLRRGLQSMPDHVFRALEDVLLSLGAIVIFCDAPVHIIRRRIESRCRDTVPPALGRECGGFRLVAARSRLPIIRAGNDQPGVLEDALLLAKLKEETL